MRLQVLRGRELKPPLRIVAPKPVVRSLPSHPDEGQISGNATRKPALRFPVNPETRSFYRRFYPGTSVTEWNDWHWQIQTRIRTLEELARIFRLSEDEASAVERHSGPLPVGITPYYASLMSRDDPAEPLRRTHIMTRAEANPHAGRVRRSAGTRIMTPPRRASCTAIRTACCS